MVGFQSHYWKMLRWLYGDHSVVQIPTTKKMTVALKRNVRQDYFSPSFGVFGGRG